jgi:hypothetical protein
MSSPVEYIWPGVIAAQAIHTAGKLCIADLLSSGPRSAAELARDSSGTDPHLSACCVPLVLWEYSRSRPTVVSATPR